jgi:hypothetical protein
VGGQHHAPAALSPGKSPGTHCTGGQLDPRAILGGNGEETLMRTGVRTPEARVVASRYTDYATPAPQNKVRGKEFAKFHRIQEI